VIEREVVRDGRRREREVATGLERLLAYQHHRVQHDRDEDDERDVREDPRE
jgi:hypothetical protein